MKEKVKMKDIAYTKIKDMIISNQILPGDSVSENGLAKELGVSRTPIREALFMLEAEGFINTIPHKGPVIIKLDINDIVHIMQVREGLEGIAARIAAETANKFIFKEIAEELEQINNLEDFEQKEQSFEIGRRLHNEILEASGNTELIKIVKNMNTQLNRIMLISRDADKRSLISHKEHIIIANAIIERNPDLAEKSIRNHIIGASNDAVKVYQQSYR